MNKLILLVGLPGSGKSTYAHELMEELTESSLWLSSDSIRKELYGDESIQGDPNKVFRIMHQRVKASLTDGVTVIYDATNVNRKSRKQVISIANTLGITVEAHIVWCPYEICLQRDSNRDRVVGEGIIKKFLYRWETPYYDEGIDTIILVNTYSNHDYSTYESRLVNEMNISHDNPHHTASVLQHCINAHCDASNNSSDSVVISASLYHDIGKPMAKFYDKKSSEESPLAHYYSHQNVGGYLTLGLYKYPEQNDFAIDVSWLVTNHMEPFFNSKYYQNLSGLNKIRVDSLHSFDLNAH
jgi:predicted kinase